MQQQYILALDQGTTSSRAVLFDHAGSIKGMAAREFPQHYPQSGWVEHDPSDIWSTQSAVAAEVLTKANLSARSVAAVGITNQRETTVVWDKRSGEPVYPAIVWQDRRTADYCGQLRKDGIDTMLREKTGLRADPYFSATKIKWILDNVGGARRDAEAGHLLFGTIDSWLIWRFTAGAAHVTDVTNASRTLLFDIHRRRWDAELLELFGIPPQMLPEVRSCSEEYGRVDDHLYPAGAPITGSAGDQQAALFGQGCFKKGMAKNTYGTGCFLLMNTGETPVTSENELLTTIAWEVDGTVEYALEGSVFIGGAVVQWLRDELQLIRTAAECDRLAESVDDAAGLFLVPAFAGLGAPWWDPYARGIAIGITRGTNRAHFCRAAIESIAHQCADLIGAMVRDSGIELSQLRVDGGAARSNVLLQFQADLLQTEVIRPRCIETTALGAAYLAGLATGFWSELSEIEQIWQPDRKVEPQRDATTVAQMRTDWHRAVERSRNWTNENE